MTDEIHDDAHDDATALTETEAAILGLEQSWWRHSGAKETLICDKFDMSLTRYSPVLNSLIDKPAALVADPVPVNRLRQVRAARQRARAKRGDTLGES